MLEKCACGAKAYVMLERMLVAQNHIRLFEYAHVVKACAVVKACVFVKVLLAICA